MQASSYKNPRRGHAPLDKVPITVLVPLLSGWKKVNCTTSKSADSSCEECIILAAYGQALIRNIDAKIGRN